MSRNFKLPLKSYQKIETVQVYGDKILGVCEDGYLVEWVLEIGKGRNGL